MKHLYSRLALIISTGLVMGSFLASGAWTSMGTVSTGDQMSATLWNTLVGNVDDLNSRVGGTTSSQWTSSGAVISYTGGNVGIGTNTPLTFLHVLQRAAGIAPSLTADNGIVTFSTYTTPQLQIGGYPTSPYAMWMQVKRNSNDGNSYPLSIQPLGGNVGIGTATPLMKLDVLTNSQFDLGGRFTTNSNQTSIGNLPVLDLRNTEDVTNNVGLGVRFSESGGILGQIGVWNVDNANRSGELYFATTSGGIYDERMRINKTGNVGIGTTNPSIGKLQIAGSDTQAGIYVINTRTGGNSYGIDAEAEGVNPGNLNIGWYFTANNGGNGNYAIQIPLGHPGVGVNNFAFRSESLAKSYFGGDVGLGTGSPAGKLHVIGTGAGLPATSGTSQLGLIQRLQNDNSWLAIDFGGWAGGGGWIQSTNATNLALTYPILLNPNGGKVGIGTTSPNKLLHLKTTTGTNAEFDIQSGTKPHWGIYQDETSEQLRFWNGADRISFGSGGEIGIGTVNPSTILHVTGTGTSDSNNGGQIIVGPANNLSRRLNLGYDSVGNFGFLQAVENNVAYKNLILEANGGNVGIGTINPGSKLQVEGTNSDIFVKSNIGAQSTISFEHNAGTTYLAHVGTYTQGPSNVGLAFAVGNNNITSPSMYIKQNGFIGIWTTDPALKLHVVGSNEFIRFENTSTGVNTYTQIGLKAGSATSYLWTANQNSTLWGGPNSLNIYAGAGGAMTFYTNATEKVRITTAGNVGIGTTDPGTYKLYVNGTGYLGAAAWVYSSDRRLKENISPLPYGIDTVMKLRAKKFDYIKGEKNNLGFIAQEVQETLPELVTTGSGGMLGLKTDMLIPVLVSAMQELKMENDILKSRLDAIERNTQN